MHRLTYGGVAAVHFVTIQSGLIGAARSTLPGRNAGVYPDEGTAATTVALVAFENENWPPIGAIGRFHENVLVG